MRCLAGSLLAVAGFLDAAESSAYENNLPILGDGSSALVSQAAERELARAALMQIRAGVPTVKDPILKYYARLNVHRLAEKSAATETGLATVLIDSPEINAFAVPAASSASISACFSTPRTRASTRR